MELNTNAFQLFDQTPSKDHLFIDVPCGHLKFALDFNILIEYSGIAKSIYQEAKQLSKGKQSQAISNNFNQKFQEACESLKTNQLNAQFFLCILTGKRQTLFNSDLFDFFNLSKYFEIPKLIEHIENYCESLQSLNEIFSVLANRKILDEEERNFNEFLNCGHMKQKLSKDVRKLLQIKNFRIFFPLSSIFRIFQCSEKVRFYHDENKNGEKGESIESLKKENESLKKQISEMQLNKDNQIKKLKEENDKLKKIIDKSPESQKLISSNFSSSSVSSKKSTPASKKINSKIQKAKKIESKNIKNKNSQKKEEKKSDSKDSDKSQEKTDTDIDIDLDFEEKNSNDDKSETEKNSEIKENNKSDNEIESGFDEKTKSGSDSDKEKTKSDSSSDSDDKKSDSEKETSKIESDFEKSDNGSDNDKEISKIESDFEKSDNSSDDDKETSKIESDEKSDSDSNKRKSKNSSDNDDEKSKNMSDNDFDNFDDDFVED